MGSCSSCPGAVKIIPYRKEFMSAGSDVSTRDTIQDSIINIEMAELTNSVASFPQQCPMESVYSFIKSNACFTKTACVKPRRRRRPVAANVFTGAYKGEYKLLILGRYEVNCIIH